MCSSIGGGCPKHVVAFGKSSDVRADCLDFPGQHVTRNGFGFPETAEEPHWERLAFSKGGVRGSNRRRIDPNQHLVVLGRWFCHFRDLEDIRGAVFRCHDGFHSSVGPSRSFSGTGSHLEHV
jgi:hypothetical protein